MEAKTASKIPEGSAWQYEPKWDGFRCIVFRDRRKVELQSKAGQSLTRYFPEIVQAIASLKSDRFILDGEILAPKGNGFSFDELLQRIHPAPGRIRRLATESPAILMIFDLLLTGRKLLKDETLAERRKELERFAKRNLRRHGLIQLTPSTSKLTQARKWLTKKSLGLDGIVAKRRDMTYQSGNRLGMVKIKILRTADCVVGGFRYNEGKKTVGSLLLGLYDEDGLLNHVGFTSSFKTDEKRALTAKLEKLVAPPGFTGSKPGGPSRWSTKRSALWQPVKPSLVVEVCYDHFSEGRFRHGTKLMRWRPDKAPRQCTIDQVRQGQR